MKIIKKKARSMNFLKTKNQEKNYTNLISKIIRFKNMMKLNQNNFFIRSCIFLLSKKLYSLGLLNNINRLNVEMISINTFKKRKIKFILLTNNFTKSIEDSLILIKKKKVLIESILVTDPNLLIDRDMEKKIVIIK